MAIVWGLAMLALISWGVMVGLWGGGWWRANQRIPVAMGADLAAPCPTVAVVIPARNEADVLPESLRSLLLQDYPGELTIVLVDDQSTDNTGNVAQSLADELHQRDRFTVLTGQPLPPGWTGKLWAMEQGVQFLQSRDCPPDYVLFTDADIRHDRTNLRQLVGKAEADALDLVSLMVLLRCQSPWEKLLIPAFVFFFQLLYPFPWVNARDRNTAGAAGGCVLLRRSALERIGGVSRIHHALIDDCTLGAAVKEGGPIWLGLSDRTLSLRPYDTLGSIWDMVARTAYTQLHYSPGLLMGTVLGMGLVYLVPPIAMGLGMMTADGGLALVGGVTWGLMALAYWPTLQLYRCSPMRAFTLPLIAFLYTLMTLDSARRHWAGQGGAWKGRVYPRAEG